MQCVAGSTVKIFYDRLVPVNETTVPDKWLNEVGDISVEEWKRINRNVNDI